MSNQNGKDDTKNPPSPSKYIEMPDKFSGATRKSRKPEQCEWMMRPKGPQGCLWELCLLRRDTGDGDGPLLVPVSEYPTESWAQGAVLSRKQTLGELRLPARRDG